MGKISNGGAAKYYLTGKPAPDEFVYDDQFDFGQLNESASDLAIGLTGEEVIAGGAVMSPIDLRLVERADLRVRATGVLERIPQWRLEDGGPKGPGGQPARFDDRLILIALLLLACEKQPLWLTNVRNIFAIRLTPDAREYLGLPPLDALPDEVALHNMYNACRNAFERMLDPMDPYVQPKFLQFFDQRKCLLENLDRERAAQCKARLDWFSNAFLHMSFMMQDRDVRRANRKVNISFDQTYVAPVNTNSYTDTRDAAVLARATELDLLERPLDRDERKARNRKLEDRGVGEVFAGLYIVRPDKREVSVDKNEKAKTEMKWGWAANVAVRVTDNPKETTPFPLLIMALTFSMPGTDVSKEAVTLMKSIAARGHQPGYAAADNDYWAHADIEKLHTKALETGFKPLTRYRKDTLGKKGGYAGAIQVEGDHYCPGMPTDLVEATIHYEAGVTDLDTYRTNIAGRKQFALRNKERPAPDGSVPKMCPAFGPGATVTCVFRDVHAKSSKKEKTAVKDEYRPDTKLEICTKTSVKFPAHKFEQLFDFGTVQHEELITSARQSAEGTFGQLKDAGYEALNSTQRRRARGYAAAQVFVTMMLVAFNLRKIAAFARQLAQNAVKKKRKPSEAYRPYVDKRRVEREHRREQYLAAQRAQGPEPPSQP
jgi:hypothetical protein